MFHDDCGETANLQEYRLFKRYLSKAYGAVSDSVLGP